MAIGELELGSVSPLRHRFRLSNGSLSTPTTYACPRRASTTKNLARDLKLVAVFDDEERRVPIHLGKEDPTA